MEFSKDPTKETGGRRECVAILLQGIDGHDKLSFHWKRGVPSLEPDLQGITESRGSVGREGSDLRTRIESNDPDVDTRRRYEGRHSK